MLTTLFTLHPFHSQKCSTLPYHLGHPVFKGLHPVVYFYMTPHVSMYTAFDTGG